MPLITLTPSGWLITFATGELVVCESKEQAEEFLDWVENRKK